MTLGQLIDKIRQVEKAERDLTDAQISLSHGGNDNTIKNKQRAVDFVENHLEILRREEI